MSYAEVLLPLAVVGTYTYAIPADMTLETGMRVLVPFGRKKIYTAIVTRIHDIKPTGYDVKEIFATLDDHPIVRHPQLKFWDWIADYYLCTTGEVYRAAVPTGLKVESETFVAVNPEFEEDASTPLTDRERALLDYAAQRDRTQIAELARITGFKGVERTVSHLLDYGAMLVSERVVDNYRPKTERCVRLTLAPEQKEELNAFFDQVGKAPKQEKLLLAYLDLSHWLQGTPKEVRKDDLLQRADVSQQVLDAAVKKGIFEIYKREINRFAQATEQEPQLPTLSAEQSRAYGEIHQSWGTHDITLLRGVTSSGKTAIYIHLISDALRHGNSVLYLVPEIALTTQLTQRLRKHFGDKLLVYHSRFNDNERVDIWKRLLASHDPCVVIGVRSSIFLPFAKLGLVIVDEEHDASYKQQDPAPRYNGRNAALILAKMHGAKTLLGSATPAIEVYHRALAGQYGLVELTQRYGDITMPDVQVIDLQDARHRKEMTGMFSNALIRRCREALKAGEQIILFQNRRGYAPMVRCKQCDWIPKCQNCDVTLTYHKHTRNLICHYCGYTISLPTVCPVCGMPSIEILGYGTERIHDDIETIFEGEKISRMDLDTTRSKSAYDRIIDEFSKHRTNILVGTQMVTKGLDFDAVSVVGILNADNMLSFPDFRSHERGFDMLEQVAGRAGRAHKQGTVLIQTSNQQNPVIQFVINHDYLGFYQYELAQREQFGFPPFTRIIDIYIKHHDQNITQQIALGYAALLRQIFGTRVLGPQPPVVARVQTYYIRKITLKLELNASLTKVKKLLRDSYVTLLTNTPAAKAARIYYDVDPV